MFRNTDQTWLQVAVSAVAVLKVWTSRARLVRRSICICKKSWPQVEHHWLLENVQADAAIHTLRHLEGEQEVLMGQVVCLDMLARRTSLHVFLEGCKHTLPPYLAPGE